MPDPERRLPQLSSRAEGFDRAYDGVPPWDIGRPQPEVQRLADGEEFVGTVLDVGCGTGENALELARRGVPVCGADFSPRAIERARAKARSRGAEARFEVVDALHLDRLGRTFDSVLDVGLFHVFDDAERPRYVRSLHDAVRPGGRYFLLCFSDAEPEVTGGPRRVSESEIRSAFQRGWRVEYVRPTRFETNLPGFAPHAWCARLSRGSRRS